MTTRRKTGDETENCTKCGSSLPKDGTMVLCNGYGKCKLRKACSGLGESTIKAMSSEAKAKWACKECRKIPSTEESGTSKDGQQETEGIFSSQKNNITLETIGKHLQEISVKVRAISNLENMVTELQTSVTFMNNMYDDFMKKIKEQEEKINCMTKNMDILAKSSEDKDKKIKELQDKLHEMEQYSRNRNVELTNVPEKKEETTEDLLDLVEKVAEIGEIPFNKEDVDVIHRLPNKKKNSPRNVVIQFKSRTARNLFLGKRNHGVKVGDLIGKEYSRNPTPIYINEHLTSQMKHLLWTTKQAARGKGYTLVWVKEGKIFVKKDFGAIEIVRIRKEEDLNLM